VVSGHRRLLSAIASPVTTLANRETGHSCPQFLPDGKRVLYLARGGKPGIYVQTIGSKDRTLIMESIGRAVYAPPGLLIFLRDNTLFAQRLNLDTLRLEGEPFSVAEGVRSGGTNGRNAFDVSSTGVLVYRGGGTGTFQVSAYTRAGMREAVVIEEVFFRLTSAADPERDQVWSPDSRILAYEGGANGKDTLFATVVGSGKHVPMRVELPLGFALKDWMSDGTQLVLRRGGTVADTARASCLDRARHHPW
jgi:WD40 repeat protein